MADPTRKDLEGISSLILRNGDCMEQARFHHLYSEMPEDYRAELIGGIVFEPSPVGYAHSSNHIQLCYLLQHYAISTTGVEAGDNGTVILGVEDEVQPDLFLRIMPAYGGHSRNITIKEGKEERPCEYVAGAPELVAEVAYSSFAIDLHFKKKRYKLAGVLEYIVLCLDPQRFHWFDLRNDRELTPEVKSVFKSKVFPGLWLDSDAILRLEHQRTVISLNEGLNSPEHKRFLTKLRNRSI